MDIGVYRLVHMIGLIMLFQTLGASLYYSRSGETDHAIPEKMLKAMHGIAMLLLLLGGFGMLAKLKIFWPMPIWIWIKLVVWVSLGASLILVSRRPESSRTWWIMVLVLGAIAAAMGSLKPF